MKVWGIFSVGYDFQSDSLVWAFATEELAQAQMERIKLNPSHFNVFHSDLYVSEIEINTELL